MMERERERERKRKREKKREKKREIKREIEILRVILEEIRTNHGCRKRIYL